MNFLNAAGGMFGNQFKGTGNDNKEKSQAQNVLETLAPVVTALAQDQQKSTVPKKENKPEPEPEKDATQSIIESLAPVVASMVAQQQTQNTDSIETKKEPNMFETLAPMLNLLPNQEEKKDKIFEYLGPVVKVLSPKWGDVIVLILRKLDVAKLLDFTKDEKELEKKVREEEKRLEKTND